MPLERGSLLYNRYQIEEPIATGGMGAVYCAVDQILGVRVAIKENFYTTAESARQFRREATILAALKHPNLPRVTDHFEITGQGQYLAMDFIEGVDLRQVLAAGLPPLAETVRIGLEISEALEYLHSRNPPVVHRDIKPGNIKISPNRQVYLVDFGLAKLAQGEATTTGAQGLTPGYAPPEQYGQGTEPRSDLYALGATLYNALTGKVPEDGLSRKMGTAELTPIRKHNPAVPEPIARVIERAMAVEVEDRYPDARAFRQALAGAALRAGLVTEVKGSETSYPPAPEPPLPAAKPAQETMRRQSVSPSPALPARRRLSGWVAAGLLVLFILLGAVGVILWRGLLPFSSAPSPVPTGSPPPTAIAAANTSLPTPAPTLTPAPTATPAPTSTAAVAEAAILPSPTLEPSPTVLPSATAPPLPAGTPTGGGAGWLAFASTRGGGKPQVWVMDPDGGGARQITRLADGACQPSWSPDGARLVFISPCEGKQDSYPGSSLYLINRDGSGLQPLASLPGGDFDPAWSPDGKQIAFTSLRDGKNQVYLYHLADHTVTRLSRPVNIERRPQWSWDGTRLAYETNRLGQPQIWTVDMTAPDPSQTAKAFSLLEGGFAHMPAWSPDGSVLIYSQGSSPARFALVARQVDNPQAQEFKVTDKISGIENACFSPDGWWIAFSMTQDGVTAIYRIQRNGSSLTRLSAVPDADFHPAWGP